MPEYTWMCLNEQDSEYAWSLNMPIFWIWQSSEYERVLNMKALHCFLNKTKICFERVLNISWVLNMPGFWIWQYSEYARVTHGSKYATTWLNMSAKDASISEFTITDRVLNMYHIIDSAKPLYKLMITYWKMGVLRTRLKI